MRILLTGMSGVGKSALLRALKTQDNLTIDLDYDNWIADSEEYGERAIDVPRVLRLFEENPGREIFLAGTAINQGKLYPLLDEVVVLTVPIEVMRGRVMARKEHDFGKSPQEWAQNERDKAEIEPLLIRGASLVCETTGTIEDAVKTIRAHMQK